MSPRSLARVASSFDGLERISTQAVMFEVPQRQRAIGAYRHLAGLMAEPGWTAVRVRDFIRRGFKEQVAVMFACSRYACRSLSAALGNQLLTG